MNAASVGLGLDPILLPQTDLQKWAVIACDQFTANRAYWQQVETIVGSAPSTLRITLPEIDLNDVDLRVPAIHKTMDQYLENVLLRRVNWVYVQRKTQRMTRRGIVLPVDLECYDFSPESTSLIRATEGTILDRLQPRMRIRRGASVETPHILLLIDDPGCTVIEPLAALTEQPPLYDVELMLEGGQVTGWELAEESQRQVISALTALLDSDVQHQKYGDIAAPLLYAAGDGNHSLATARAYWLELRETLSETERENHPARYALVELGNLHDSELQFEPIHRVLFDTDAEDLIRSFKQWLAQHQGQLLPEPHSFPLHYGNNCRLIQVSSPPYTLPVATLQAFLDEYTAAKHIEMDYIHGETEALELSKKGRNVAILLPATDKTQLFKAVLRDGALPRKTFSIGEAQDKRYYMECRKIIR